MTPDIPAHSFAEWATVRNALPKQLEIKTNCERSRVREQTAVAKEGRWEASTLVQYGWVGCRSAPEAQPESYGFRHEPLSWASAAPSRYAERVAR